MQYILSFICYIFGHTFPPFDPNDPDDLNTRCRRCGKSMNEYLKENE